MANVKISALPAVTTVVPGTDVLPLVSGGITTKATPNAIINASLANQTSLSLYGGAWTLANSTTISAASTKTLTLNGGAGSNGLVLDASNNVGIGTASPTYKLDVSASSGNGIRYTSTSTGGTVFIGDFFGVPAISTGTNSSLIFGIQSTQKMLLDTSGNLGLGVTPSGWSGVNAIELPAYGHVAAANTQLNFSVNAYYNGGYKYKNTGTASFFNANNNSFTWNLAPSGTAGNAISFTQAMTLDASGSLGVGTTNPVASSGGATAVTINGTSSSVIYLQSNGTSVGYIQGQSTAVNLVAASVPLNITATGANAVNFNTNGSTRLGIGTGGVVTITNLAGSGSRAVNADASGNLSAASDSSLKQEEKSAYIPGLKEILELTPRAYKWLSDIEIRGEDAATEIGFFADEVAPIIPSAAPKCADGLYGFYDRSVTAALVKAIQELSAELESLKQKVNS